MDIGLELGCGFLGVDFDADFGCGFLARIAARIVQLVVRIFSDFSSRRQTAEPRIFMTIPQKAQGGPERHLDAARQKLPRDNFCRSLAAQLPSPRGQF